jgi:ABC-type sugar transport system, periplasmic component
MRSMKRFGLICLLVALIGSLLAGCGGGTGGAANGDKAPANNQPDSGPKDAGNAAKPEDQQKEVTISWWGAWGEDAGPANIIKHFNEKYPNIHVRYVQFNNTDEGNVKIDTALLASEDIDVFFNYNVTRFDPRAKKNLLLDLTPYLERDQFNVEEELGTGILTYDGKYYGLPVSSVSNAVFINKKMLDAANLPVPEKWTIEEFKQYAAKLTQGAGADKVYGAADFHSMYYWANPARGTLGSNAWYKEDGTSNFDHPAFKTSLQFKYDMENVEKIQYPYTEYKASKAQAFDIFMQQKAAMVVASNAMARFLKDTEKYPRDFIATAAPLPTLEKDQAENFNLGLQYFGFLAISKNSKHKDEAWTFMKWLATEGSVYLAEVGHIPTWKKTDKDEVVKIMLGEDADKIVDVEAFKRVVLNNDQPSYNDTELTAYAQVYKIMQDEAEKVMFDMQTVDEAIQVMKKESDEAIKNANN